MQSIIYLFMSGAGHVTAEPANFLRITWHQQTRTLADTQALLEQLLWHLQHRGWSRVLIDQTAMAPFDGREQVWVTTDWLPRAVQQGGYRHGAVVVSPAVLARLATAYITTSVQDLPLEYRSFETETEALSWLLAQPATP